MMIKTQYIKKDDKTIAVILDYKEYKRLKEIKEDKKWTRHEDLKKELGLK